MKKKEIKQHIDNAISAITPDIYENAANTKIVRYQRMEDVTGITEKRTGHRKLFMGGAASLLAVIAIVCGIFYYRGSFLVDTTIMMDVNPSIEITTNRNDKVLEVIPLNADAATVLEGMELDHLDYMTAINAIIGSMLSNGFLDGETLTALITIKNSNHNKAEIIQSKVNATINNAISSSSVLSTIYEEGMENTEVLDLAVTSQISVGKAWLCISLAKTIKNLSAENLAAMPMEEILRLSAEYGIDMHSLVNYDNSAYTPLDKSLMISEDNAKEIAIKETGGGITKEIELDYERSYWQYEITVLFKEYEYEYDIHAYTGEILHSSREKDDDYVAPQITEVPTVPAITNTPAPTPSVLPFGKQQAIDAALADAKGGTLVSYEFDSDDNCHEISLRVANDKYEYEVNAATGKLTLVDIDRNEYLKPTQTPNNNTGNNGGNTAGNNGSGTSGKDDQDDNDRDDDLDDDDDSNDDDRDDDLDDDDDSDDDDRDDDRDDDLDQDDDVDRDNYDHDSDDDLNRDNYDHDSDDDDGLDDYDDSNDYDDSDDNGGRNDYDGSDDDDDSDDDDGRNHYDDSNDGDDSDDNGGRDDYDDSNDDDDSDDDDSRDDYDDRDDDQDD